MSTISVHPYDRRHRAAAQVGQVAHVVVIDPITNLLSVGTQTDVRAMLTRVIDFFKMQNITAVFTSLTAVGAELAFTEAMISSLMDTWVLASTEEVDRRRHRWLYVLKSRGMAHSDEMREFRLTGHGVDIMPHRSAGRAGG